MRFVENECCLDVVWREVKVMESRFMRRICVRESEERDEKEMYEEMIERDCVGILVDRSEFVVVRV